jgi:hypothetical protein
MNKVFKFGFLGVAAFIAMLAVFSAAAMLLWNVLMTEIFALPVINYWQAAGMVILARILFGGGTGRFGLHKGRFHHGNPMREKWMNMSEEERREFMRSHPRDCHHPPFFGETENAKRKDAPGGDGGEAGA